MREPDVQESYVPVKGGSLYVRHTEIDPMKKTVLFLHGLGESGLSFSEAFDEIDLKEYNIVIPDLLGYGRSSAAKGNDYSFEAQIKRIWQLADHQHFDLQEIHLIGHSLGGDLATSLCEQDDETRIKSLVNVEGNLTSHDLFISRKVAWAAKRPNFKQWFRDEFKQKIVFEDKGKNSYSWRRYYASLWFCRPEAFGANATELYEKNLPIEGKLACEAGARFQRLGVKKVFCWGDESLHEATIDFLAKADFKNRSFRGAGHWPMIDCQEEFYGFLRVFLAGA